MSHSRKTMRLVLSTLPLILSFSIICSASPKRNELWAHDNIVAWEVIPYDAAKRGHEERAKMFQRLGIQNYAYIGYPQEPTDEQALQLFVDAEIEAMKRHGINLLAWYLWIDEDPLKDRKARLILESFKRHDIRPQLWIAQSHSYFPKSPQEWTKHYPPGEAYPQVASLEEFWKILERDASVRNAFAYAYEKVNLENYPATPQERLSRLEKEANRIQSIVRLAEPYQCQVNLYNHTGWYGLIENQLAIINRLQEKGVKGVGMVYNFSHARDGLHDDSKNFRYLWKQMQQHVVAVNITAMTIDFGVAYYPSQGEGELEMMRTIEQSGWQGPIGLVVMKPYDAEVVLRNDLLGLDWLAAELAQPGSGGPRPFPAIAPSR